MKGLDLLGRGWAFPIVPSYPARRMQYSAGPEKIRTAIWLILMTSPGERVMRPEFGSGLRRFIMEPNSVATRALIQREVYASLDRWEPRIRLRDVTVEPGADPAEVLIRVHYEHRLDGRADLLVYPFSLDAQR